MIDSIPIENIFERASSINALIKEKSSYQPHENSVLDKALYWKHMNYIETYIAVSNQKKIVNKNEIVTYKFF